MESNKKVGYQHRKRQALQQNIVLTQSTTTKKRETTTLQPLQLQVLHMQAMATSYKNSELHTKLKIKPSDCHEVEERHIQSNTLKKKY